MYLNSTLKKHCKKILQKNKEILPMVQSAMASKRMVQLEWLESREAIVSGPKPSRNANKHQSLPCGSGGSNKRPNFSFVGAERLFTFNAHPQCIFCANSTSSVKKYDYKFICLL